MSKYSLESQPVLHSNVDRSNYIVNKDELEVAESGEVLDNQAMAEEDFWALQLGLKLNLIQCEVNCLFGLGNNVPSRNSFLITGVRFATNKQSAEAQRRKETDVD